MGRIVKQVSVYLVDRQWRSSVLFIKYFLFLFQICCGFHLPAVLELGVATGLALAGKM